MLNKFRMYYRPYAKLTLIILLISLIVSIGSYMYFFNNPTDAKMFFKEMISGLEDKGFESENTKVETLLRIICNNVLLSLIMVLIGLIPVLVLPLFTTIMTFFAVGLVTAIFEQKIGKGFDLLFFGILPHGLLELVAFVISSSIGIRLSYFVLKKLIMFKRKEVKLKTIFILSMKSYLAVVVPIMVAASFIECFISPYILKLFVEF